MNKSCIRLQFLISNRTNTHLFYALCSITIITCVIIISINFLLLDFFCIRLVVRTECCILWVS